MCATPHTRTHARTPSVLHTVVHVIILYYRVTIASGHLTCFAYIYLVLHNKVLHV